MAGRVTHTTSIASLVDRLEAKYLLKSNGFSLTRIVNQPFFFCHLQAALQAIGGTPFGIGIRQKLLDDEAVLRIDVVLFVRLGHWRFHSNALFFLRYLRA